MNGVYLDTVGLVALWNRQDQWHEVATRAFAGLVRSRVPLVSTSFVFLECGNAASRHIFRSLACELRAEMAAGGSLIVPTSEDEEAAWDAYHRGEAGSAGIVDHVSFVVMRRLGLTRAFTHDAHFRAAAFETLF